MKLLANGFESPTYNTQIINNRPTTVAAPANINYMWKANDPKDAGLWQNVEYVNIILIKNLGKI